MLQLIFLLIYLSYNDGNEDGKNTKTSYKRQERAKKSHETYMKRLNEDIVRHNQLSSSSFKDNSTPSTSSSTNNFSTSSSTRSSDPICMTLV